MTVTENLQMLTLPLNQTQTHCRRAVQTLTIHRSLLTSSRNIEVVATGRSLLPWARFTSYQSAAQSINVTFGNESTTIEAPIPPTLTDLTNAVRRVFNIPVVQRHCIRLYHYDDFDAKPITQLELAALSPEDLSTLYARSSAMRFVQYAGQVRHVHCPSSFRTFSDLLHHLSKYLNINVPHLALYQKTPKGIVNVDLCLRVPNIDEDSTHGFSYSFPLLLTRTDQIQVKVEKATRTIFVEIGSSYYQVAKIVQTLYFPAASCARQIVLSYGDAVSIDLSSKLPPYSPSQRVLHAKMMTKNVLLVENKADASPKEAVFASDNEIRDFTGGLVEVGSSGGYRPYINSLHLLKDGARYITKRTLDDPFSWRKVRS